VQIIDEDTRRFGRLLHYAGVLATVVCATAGYSFLHAPAVHEIVERSARIDELLESVRNGPITRQHHHIAEEKLRSVTTRIANLRKRVPSTSNAGAFLKEVTQLAEGDQLAIKDFHPEKPDTKAGYGEMQVTLKGQGSFGSVCTFIEQLTKLTRLSKIKDLTLSAGDNPAEYPMTATLVIYFGLRGTGEASAAEGHRG
jgi:Tfp pilus assembly protein PilO